MGDGSGDGVTASWYSSSSVPASEGATRTCLRPEVVSPLLIGIGMAFASSLSVSTSCSWSGTRSASCMLREYEDATEGVTAREAEPDPSCTLSVSPSSPGFRARLRVVCRRLRNQFVTFARSLPKMEIRNKTIKNKEKKRTFQLRVLGHRVLQ